jgi:hypothetical protein
VPRHEIIVTEIYSLPPAITPKYTTIPIITRAANNSGSKSNKLVLAVPIDLLTET